MKFNSGCADTFVPDGSEPALALERTTRLGIGAHADDLEILAWPGIAHCHDTPDHWFTGVVITDGAGSPRGGAYGEHSDADMAALRRREQQRAAERGGYSVQFQLGYTSAELKGERCEDVCEDLTRILAASQPDTVYLHNLADAHATHVAAASTSIDALRRLPREQQPANVYGVEVWRNLDWLPSRYRLELEVDPDNTLQGALLREFESQLQGGKRYDLAVAGRQVANATFSQSHRTDRFRASVLAMDLSPLLQNPALAPADFLRGIINEFSEQLLKGVAADDIQ